MTTKKGTQYYLDSTLPGEAELIGWIESLEATKRRGSKSNATIRLLLAGLYLERINPTLVDVLNSDFNNSKVPNIAQLSDYMAMFSEQQKPAVRTEQPGTNSPSTPVDNQDVESDENDGFLTLGV